MTDEAKIARVREILSQQFHSGSRVTNCAVHMGRFDSRPTDCRLCAADIRNHLALAIRMNEWLNGRLDDMRKVVDG